MGRLSSIEDVERRSRRGRSDARRRETASPEEDFHGLAGREPLGAGHTALVALAVLVALAAVAYVLNYWLHFV